MSQDRADYWEALELASCATGMLSFTRAIRKILKAINFGGLYFLAPVVADRRVGRVLWNIGFPKEVEQYYREHGWLVDPLPDIALNRGSAFRWSDAPRIAPLTKTQKKYLTTIGEGVAVPCTGPFARAGFVGVGLARREVVLDDALLRRVQVAAQLCFQRYCELVNVREEEIPDLSERELDVIRWIAEGKGNAVIAEILGISKNSVDSYVKRIFIKLGVSDRTAAAVKAVALGLIATGKHSKKGAHRASWKT